MGLASIIYIIEILSQQPSREHCKHFYEKSEARRDFGSIRIQFIIRRDR